MADTDNENDSENSRRDRTECAHCSKETKNSIQCGKCLKSYHSACLIQSATQKSTACRHVPAYAIDDCWEQEKQLYKLIVAMLEERNADLLEKNRLLNEENGKLRKSEEKEEGMNNLDGCPSCALLCQENAHLKEMNTELKNHCKEVSEHNSYLRSLEQKTQQTLPQLSYAAVTSNTKEKSDSMQLIIKPSEEFKGDILKLVQNVVSEQKNAKVLNIRKNKNESVIVKCMNKQCSDLISETLHSRCKDKLQVSQPEKRNPKVKIIDICSDLSDKQLTEDINERNEFQPEDFKIIHTFKQRNRMKSLIAEVTPKAYSKIMQFKSIFVGYQNCRAFDDFNDKMCKKCCGYGHSTNKCNRIKDGPPICPKCSKTHESTECESNETTCINCKSANKYLQKKRDVSHTADDKSHCESYKIRWERHVNSTNYPWRPRGPFAAK